MTDQPTPPEPDDKDWTWVVHTACVDCGFDPAALDVTGTGPALRATIPRWQAVLSRSDVRERSNPSTWSALEYACHVRDVCDVMRGRLEAMLAEDGVGFPNWDQDAAAVAAQYWTQDPSLVAADYARTAEQTAVAFDTVDPTAWAYRGVRSNGSVFTVATLATYFLHDITHHLADVRG